LGGETKAYPLKALKGRPVVNDVLGGQTVVIVTVAGGLGSRVYQRAGHRFLKASLGADEATVLTDTD